MPSMLAVPSTLTAAGQSAGEGRKAMHVARHRVNWWLNLTLLTLRVHGQLSQLEEQLGYLCGEPLVPPQPEQGGDSSDTLRTGWTDSALRTPKQGQGLFVRQESMAYKGQRLRCSDPVERLCHASSSFKDSNTVCYHCSESSGSVNAQLAQCFSAAHLRALPGGGLQAPHLPASEPPRGQPGGEGSQEGSCQHCRCRCCRQQQHPQPGSGPQPRPKRAWPGRARP